MSLSSEFRLHTNLLHDNVRRLLGRAAVTPEQQLGAGLLNRRYMDGNFFRPRLIVVSGLADMIGHILQEEVPEDSLIVGATSNNNPNANISRLYAVGPGLGKDIFRKSNLDAGRIAQFSHSVRVAEAEHLTPDQTDFLHTRVTGIVQSLGQLQPQPSPHT